MVLGDRTRPDEADLHAGGCLSSHQLAMSQRRMKLTLSMPLRVLDELAQHGGARGLAAPALMHCDGHHRAALLALAHELVEAHLQGLEEVARAREARVHEEARVVVGLRVRDHEHRGSAGSLLVVRHVVGTALGVVEEAAELLQDPARVLARPATRVPADRAAAEHALEGLDRAQDRGALLLPRERPGLGPAPAVAHQVVIVLAHPLRHGGVQLERDGGARDRHGDLASSKMRASRHTPARLPYS